MHWTCCETAESIRSSSLLNSSKQPHAPTWQRPTKIRPIACKERGKFTQLQQQKEQRRALYTMHPRQEEAVFICRLLHLKYCKRHERVLKFSFQCFTEPQKIIAPYYSILHCSLGKPSPLHNVLFADTINIRCSSSPLLQGGYKNYKTFQKSKLDGQSMVTFLHKQ